jgi:hypothetical protein
LVQIYLVFWVSKAQQQQVVSLLVAQCLVKHLVNFCNLVALLRVLWVVLVVELAQALAQVQAHQI